MQNNSATASIAVQYLSVAWTEFSDLSGTTKTEQAGTWPELVSLLQNPREYPTKEAMPLMSGASFGEIRTSKGSLRNNDNVKAVHMLVGDYDAERVPIEDAAERLRNAGVLALIFPTAHHTPEAPRWRVLAPLSQPCDREAFPACLALLNGALGGILAGESATLSQSFYIGRVSGKPWHLTVINGPEMKPIDTDDVRLFIDPVEVKASGKVARGSDVGDNPPVVPMTDDEIVGFSDVLARAGAEFFGKGTHPMFFTLMQACKHAELCGHPTVRDEFAGLVHEHGTTNKQREWERDWDGWSPKTPWRWVFTVLGQPAPTATGLQEIGHEGDRANEVLARLRDMPEDERMDRWPDMVLSIYRHDMRERVLAGLVPLLGVGKRSLNGTLKQEEERRAKLAGAGETQATHHTYAKQLLKTIEEARGHPPVGYVGMMFAPDDHGIFEGRDADRLATDVAELLDAQDGCTRRNDYTAIAAHALSLCRQDEFFNTALIGLAAGDLFFYVDAGTGLQREPLTAAHRQRFRHPTAPQAMPTPNFDKLLSATFAGEGCEEQTEFIQEVFGAIALGLLPQYEKAVLMYGPGRSGKGSLTKIIENLVPPGTQAAAPPAKWDHEYYLSCLAGMRLNLVGELNDDKPIPAAEFKSVTGRDLLTGRDPAGKPFSFRCSAAQVFSSNYFPSTRDQSEAFFSRWLIVGCLNSRLEGDLDIDTQLAGRVIATELPGVLDWALKGAERLAQRGRFKVTSVHQKLMGRWRQRADSVQEFLMDEDACQLDPTASLKRVKLFEEYQEWSRKSGRSALAKTKFNERLESPAMARLGLICKRDRERGAVVIGVTLVDPRVFPF